MAKCDKKRFKRTLLCAGDLRHKLTLQTRALQYLSPDQTSPEEEFKDVLKLSCAVETVSGTSKFAKVNINDDASHLFYVRYSKTVADIEVNNNFILFEGRRMKILEVTNNDEDKRFIIIQCTERGCSDKEAVDA